MMQTRLKQLPGELLAPLRRRLFKGSSTYWQDRYANGADSGAGSYGELARFKADVLNGYVAEHSVSSVIEFGCGDGHQLSLAEYPRYLGLDVAPDAIERCRDRFSGDESKSFYLYSTPHFIDRARTFHADLAVSLDVLYHLVEDEVFTGYLKHLFAAADRFVVIYSSDEEFPDAAPHVRHRNFTRWVAEHVEGWKLIDRIANPVEDSAAVAEFFVYCRA